MRIEEQNKISANHFVKTFNQAMVNNLLEPMNGLRMHEITQCNDEAIDHEHGLFQSRMQREDSHSSPESKIKSTLTSTES